jgi:hypothetical protein
MQSHELGVFLIAGVSIRNGWRDEEIEDVDDPKEVEEKSALLLGAHRETLPLQARISPNPNSLRIHPDLA